MTPEEEEVDKLEKRLERHKAKFLALHAEFKKHLETCELCLKNADFCFGAVFLEKEAVLLDKDTTKLDDDLRAARARIL